MNLKLYHLHQHIKLPSHFLLYFNFCGFILTTMLLYHILQNLSTIFDVYCKIFSQLFYFYLLTHVYTRAYARFYNYYIYYNYYYISYIILFIYNYIIFFLIYFRFPTQRKTHPIIPSKNFRSSYFQIQKTKIKLKLKLEI